MNMSQSLSVEQATALRTGVEAVIRRLGSTSEYDFDLQHIRKAYIDGVNAYLEEMTKHNLRHNIFRIDFENALRLCLPLHATDDHHAMKIKRILLMTSLNADILIYNAHWEDAAHNDFQLHPITPAGVVSTEESIAEMRYRLLSYRMDLRASRPELMEEATFCVRMWNELANGTASEGAGTVNAEKATCGLEDRAKEKAAGLSKGMKSTALVLDNDNTDLEKARRIAAANANDNPNRKHWGAIIDLGEGWVKRDSGLWHCTNCRFHGGVQSAVSMQRHLFLTHQMEIEVLKS